MKNIDIFAITGNSGSGKNLACQYFSELGLNSIDADELARIVLKKNASGYAEVVDFFGEKILCNDGNIDRKKLATLVFSKPNLLKKLEKIVHPQVQELLKERLSQLDANTKSILYNIPLYFEKKPILKNLKATILVYAGFDICIKRICARDSISTELAKKRLSNQLRPEDKIALANFVIKNEGTKEELRKEVKRIYQLLDADKI